MVDRKILLQRLPTFKNEKNLLVEDQVTFDIINEILKAHKIYAADYDKISSFFWQGDPVSTAEYIFDFAKQNIKYDIEPSTRQTVKSPSAIIATGIFSTGLNDCKHYSQFIAGILDSLKRMGYEDIDWNYRFANYRIFETDPQHVFVVLNYNGDEYWVDPVFETFDERNSYVNKIDKKVNMALYGLAGHPSKRKIGSVTNSSVSIPGEIARGAYILMLSQNMLGTATSLFSVLQNMPADVKKWWENVGGNFSDLQSIVNVCKNIVPGQNAFPNIEAIYAAATPMLSEISILSKSDHNAQGAFEIGYESLNKYYSSNAGIGNILSDVASISSIIPGVGTAVSAGLGIISSILPIGGSSFTPSGRITQTVNNLQASFASGGINAIYPDFAATNNAGALNMRISQADGDTIMVWDGNAGANYENTGLSLSKNFGGSLKALATYAISSGYQPTALDAAYWAWLKGIATGTVTPPAATNNLTVPALQSSLFSSGSSWPLYIIIGGAAYLIFKK